MQHSQTTYTFFDLKITQTIDSRGKHNDVERFDTEGGYWEILSPSDPDYTKAIILMHNQKYSI
jgi:hypothetical protein